MTAAYAAALLAAVAYAAALRVRVATLRGRLHESRLDLLQARAVADRQTSAADYQRALRAGQPPAQAYRTALEAAILRRYEREMTTDV